MAPADSSRYNLKSPSVKRLMREACELAEPTDEYRAGPLEDNIFEWHFTIRGPPSTEFEGGLYHGRIILPTQYPMVPPNIILLTPNGRFETNKKICLSISGHHPESWQPSWSIRTALLALIAFMPTNSTGTIGSLDYTKEERRTLAKRSLSWECDVCGNIRDTLADPGSSTPLTPEETSLIGQISLAAEEESSVSEPSSDKQSTETETSQCVETTVTEQTSYVSPFEDVVWSAVIWAIVAIILFLLIRRIFFIE